MRYYFHIDELNTDEEGTELPDLAAARREVVCAARELLAASIKRGHEDVVLRFLITDAAGNILDIVNTIDVLPKSLRTVPTVT
jgi:hypothetical protein